MSEHDQEVIGNVLFQDLEKAYNMHRALTLFIPRLHDGKPSDEAIIGVLEISQEIGNLLEGFLSSRSDFKYTGNVEAMVNRVNSRP